MVTRERSLVHLLVTTAARRDQLRQPRSCGRNSLRLGQRSGFRILNNMEVDENTRRLVRRLRSVRLEYFPPRPSDIRRDCPVDAPPHPQASFPSHSSHTLTHSKLSVPVVASKQDSVFINTSHLNLDPTAHGDFAQIARASAVNPVSVYGKFYL